MKKIISVTIVMLLLFSATALAVDTYDGYNIPVDIEVNGNRIRCVEKPVLIDGTTYLPLRAFADAIGAAVSWDNAERAATLSKDGHTLVFHIERNVCTVDGSIEDYGSVIYQDLTFIPIRAVSDILGYTVWWDELYLTVKVEAPGIEVPAWCKDSSYQDEDVLYLGRIIQMECGSQPFLVKLAVASTILNRVKSPQFPNTVKGVILDTRYGTQFPPAHTASFNVTPKKENIMAAKCALGGVNPVPEALYFIDAKSAPKSWAHRNRPYLTTLSAMSFYK